MDAFCYCGRQFTQKDFHILTLKRIFELKKKCLILFGFVIPLNALFEILFIFSVFIMSVCN